MDKTQGGRAAPAGDTEEENGVYTENEMNELLILLVYKSKEMALLVGIGLPVPH